MKLARSSCEKYAKELKAICDFAGKDLESFVMSLTWDAASLAALEANRDMALVKMLECLEKYGDAAVSVSADFFEAIAANAGKKAALAGAEVAELADFTVIDKGVHFAASSLFTESGVPDVESFIARCQGTLARVITRAANDTIVMSAKASGQKVMWARVCTDEHPCEECLRLEAYGFTFDEGDFFEIHDNCHCVMVPGFGESPSIESTGNVYPEIDDLF